MIHIPLGLAALLGPFSLALAILLIIEATIVRPSLRRVAAKHQQKQLKQLGSELIYQRERANARINQL